MPLLNNEDHINFIDAHQLTLQNGLNNLEPVLTRQHRIALNQIESLQRRNNFNVFNNLNQVFNAAFAALNNRPRLELHPAGDSGINRSPETQNEQNENELTNNENNTNNDQIDSVQPPVRVHSALFPDMYLNNAELAEMTVNTSHQEQEPQRMEINEIHHQNGNELEENDVGYNYIVEEEEEVNEFEDVENEHGNFDFAEDSGEEDIIDDDDNEDDEVSQGLISLSDLHVLDLEGSKYFKFIRQNFLYLILFKMVLIF